MKRSELLLKKIPRQLPLFSLWQDVSLYDEFEGDSGVASVSADEQSLRNYASSLTKLHVVDFSPLSRFAAWI